jgi:hypothetical protein
LATKPKGELRMKNHEKTNPKIQEEILSSELFREMAIKEIEVLARK